MGKLRLTPAPGYAAAVPDRKEEIVALFRELTELTILDEANPQSFRARAYENAMHEFKGSVIAVLTEKYWDMEAAALRARESKLKPRKDQINAKVEKGELSREEGKAAQDRLYSDAFTAHELMILRESTSNFDFHYMGSAKIMSQIGKGFAEAMFDMMKQQARVGREHTRGKRRQR